MKFVDGVLLFIMLGMNYFYNNNHFSESKFLTWAYFMWNKTGLFLCVAGFLYYERDLKRRRIIKTVSVFLLIRCIWQIWEYQHEAIANCPVVLYSLYSLNAVGLYILLFMKEPKCKNKMMDDEKEISL